MAHRPRISITLHEPWSLFLAWLAAERAELPAELARGLLEQALERVRAEPAVRVAYEQYVGRGGDDPAITADIVRALEQPGVADALRAYPSGAVGEAQRAARYLGLISLWLSNDCAAAAKGPPPRLDDVLSTALITRDVAPALAYAGGADGAAVRQAAGEGRTDASDKRQLSDSAPSAGGEGTNEWS